MSDKKEFENLARLSPEDLNTLASMPDKDRDNLRYVGAVSELHGYYHKLREQILPLITRIEMFELMVDRNCDRLSRKEKIKVENYDLNEAVEFIDALRDTEKIREQVEIYKKAIKKLGIEDATLGKMRDELADMVDDLIKVDGLTGLYRKEFFRERLIQEIARSLRTGENFVLMMADIDHFGEYNDTYGHFPAGDQALKDVTSVLTQSLRQEDIGERANSYESQGGRVGGEEFQFLLYGVKKGDAFKVVDRLRENVGNTRFNEHEVLPDVRDTYCMMTADGENHGKDSTEITISVGYTVFDPKEFEGLRPSEVHDMIYKHVDKALYAAKNAGRNLVLEYAPSMENGNGKEK